MSTAVSTMHRLITDWTIGAESTIDDLLSQRKLIPTGIEALDAALKGGLPAGKVIEIYPQRNGRGEVGMLLGALRSFRRVCWVLNCAETMIPNQQGLEAAGLDLSRQLFLAPSSPREALWCVEQAAAGEECDAIVAWLPALGSKEDFHAMARVKLAASRGNVTLFLIRPFVMSGVSSPAFMRIQLFVEPNPAEVRARIVTDNYIWSSPAQAVFPLNFERVMTTESKELRHDFAKPVYLKAV